MTTTYPLILQLLKAVNFAAIKHINQRRKDSAKTPYINHSIDVANFLAENGIEDLDILNGALLHDTIEDTDTTLDEIIRLFGSNVARIVDECSDDKSLSKVERKKTQIIHAKTISPHAKLVKLADKFSNINSLLESKPVNWSPEEASGYVYWGMAVCRNLYGVNQSIDDQLKALFAKHNVDNNMSDEYLNVKLKEYYALLTK